VLPIAYGLTRSVTAEDESPDLACQACGHRWQSQPGGFAAELERIASTKVWINAADPVEPPESEESLSRRADEAVDAFQSGLAAYLAAFGVTVETARFSGEPGRRVLHLRGPEGDVALYPEACRPAPVPERDGHVERNWILSRRRLMTLPPQTPRWYVVLVDGPRGRGYLVPAAAASAAMASGDWPLGSPDCVLVAESVLPPGLVFHSAAECGALIF
jgi:hypothetical protein